MVDWTTIADEEIEEGKPIRQGTGRALRDNITAALRGSPNAPRLHVRAFEPLVAGSVVRFLDPWEDRNYTAEEKITHKLGFIQGGTVTFEFNQSGQNGAQSRAEVFYNGVPIAGSTFITSSTVVRSAVLNVAPGGFLVLRHWNNSAPTGFSRVTDVTMKTTGMNIFIAPAGATFGDMTP